MAFSAVALWKRDKALNSYIFCFFLIGFPFTLFGTYVFYQLQVVGYAIGVDTEGQPCIDYCLVPFGRRRLDLNSVLLYLNALGFGLGGAVAIFMSAYADFWDKKGLILTILLVCYGATTMPVYWLRNHSLASFNVLMALYVVYAVITYLLGVSLSAYIPHCMRLAEENEASTWVTSCTAADDVGTSSIDDAPNSSEYVVDAVTVDSDARLPPRSRKYGFRMSTLGIIGQGMAGILALVLVIILSQTLSGDAGQTAGLLLTTVFGFVTVVGSTAAFFGLPALPTKPINPDRAWWLELFTPFVDLLKRKNLLFMLLAYTVYSDTIFALSSVTGQLFFTEIKPDSLEYSLYSMAGTIFQVVFPMSFYYWQSRRSPLRLETWMIVGYSVVLVVPLWGCIGLASNVNFGFKSRWELYVQNLVINVSLAIVNSTFRVLFSELLPKGSEVEWFGMQVILACATSWVSYVANAPLQNATHNLRFPLVLCLVILIVPLVLEILRVTMKVFARDMAKWKEHDGSASNARELNTKTRESDRCSILCTRA